MQNLDPVQEILAELASLNTIFQVCVSGCDQPQVYMTSPRITDPSYFSFLKYTEKLDLE